jgi:hypothetical protein
MSLKRNREDWAAPDFSTHDRWIVYEDARGRETGRFKMNSAADESAERHYALSAIPFMTFHFEWRAKEDGR